jgi:Fe-S-cluster containining protein
MRLTEIVDAMPPEMQVKIKKKVADAIESMKTAGLFEPLNNLPRPSGPAYRELALKYLHLSLACPFLEGGSCSIYADRPLVCREYMVVSPPENCDWGNDLPVETVSLPLTPWRALAELGPGEWIPLPLSLEATQGEPNEALGTSIAKEFFENLIGRSLD